MKKLLLVLVTILTILAPSLAQESKNEKAVQFVKNVETFKSQNFSVALVNWVNYPTNLGGNQQILRECKFELTPNGATVNLPVLNRMIDQPYSVNKGEGAFKVFKFENAPYAITNNGYSKNKNLYRAHVDIKDPAETGMTVEFNLYKNGTVQLIVTCINFERTVFNGYIIPKAN